MSGRPQVSKTATSSTRQSAVSGHAPGNNGNPQDDPLKIASKLTGALKTATLSGTRRTKYPAWSW